MEDNVPEREDRRNKGRKEERRGGSERKRRGKKEGEGRQVSAKEEAKVVLYMWERRGKSNGNGSRGGRGSIGGAGQIV